MESFDLGIRDCKELLRKVMGHKMSHPFHQPVDPVMLGIPDYFDRIKHPMDLGTIKSNLARAAYSVPGAFVKDLRLVFSNAKAYNMAGTDVHVMAERVEEEFERLLRQHTKHVPSSHAPVVFAQPDVEVIPDLTGRQMSTLLNSVKRTQEAAGFFNIPVDPIALNIPDYFALILHPMDLGTIEKRLEKGMYSDTASFVADVRLVWANAKTFNGPESIVHIAAVKLDDIFERELRKACSGPGNKASVAASAPPQAAPRPALPVAVPKQPLAEPMQTNAAVTAACKPIVLNLRSHNHAKTFNSPVDFKKYPTYRALIAQPMDLKTVLGNLEHQRYATIDECHADVELIWSNCSTFNGETAWVTNHALALKAIADQKFEQARHKLVSGGLLSPRPSGGVKRKLPGGSSTPVVSANELCCITPEMRAQLTSNTARLDAMQLRSLMTVVKQCAPEAVQSTSAQSWEIDVDLLDVKCFIKVDTWVRRLLVNTPVVC